jgi:hypothetical protein
LRALGIDEKILIRQMRRRRRRMAGVGGFDSAEGLTDPGEEARREAKFAQLCSTEEGLLKVVGMMRENGTDPATIHGFLMRGLGLVDDDEDEEGGSESADQLPTYRRDNLPNNARQRAAAEGHDEAMRVAGHVGVGTNPGGWRGNPPSTAPVLDEDRGPRDRARRRAADDDAPAGDGGDLDDMFADIKSRIRVGDGRGR